MPVRMVGSGLQQGAAQPLAACRGRHRQGEDFGFAAGGPAPAQNRHREQRRRRRERPAVRDSAAVSQASAKAGWHAAPPAARHRRPDRTGATSSKSFAAWQLGVRRAQIKRRRRRHSARAASAPAAPPTAHRAGGCRKAQSRRPAFARRRPRRCRPARKAPKARMRATARRTAAPPAAATIVVALPQQQIGFVALGVMDRGGARLAVSPSPRQPSLPVW